MYADGFGRRPSALGSTIPSSVRRRGGDLPPTPVEALEALEALDGSCYRGLEGLDDGDRGHPSGRKHRHLAWTQNSTYHPGSIRYDNNYEVKPKEIHKVISMPSLK